MKNLLKSILFLTAISIFTLTSCANGSSGGGNDNSEAINIAKSITFSDISFDSFNYTLEANTTAPDGTSIAAAANNHATTAVASKGKISWNMAESFHNGILGAKNYEIYFSYEGTSITSTKVSYYPEIKYEINSQSTVYLFNGSGKTYQYPEITIKNYEQDDIVIEKWFRIAGGNCDIEGFKEFIDDEKNIIETDENGKVKEEVEKTAYLYYDIYPESISELTEGNRLYQSGCISYLYKKEVKVNYVRPEYKAGVYEAKTYTANPDANEESLEAGGNIIYQWEISDTGNSWKAIDGATSRCYKVQEADSGKYLRVKMTQTIQEGNKTLDSITSESTGKILNGIKSANLYYDGIIISGGKFDSSKVKGNITTIFDTKLDLDKSFTIELKYPKNETYESMEASQNAEVKISRSNFETSDASVFVPVQHKLEQSDLPALSTDTDKLMDGHVDFTTINADLEFSKDDKKTWSEMPQEAFTAKTGDLLYFRKRAVGTPNTTGYIKESSPLYITVEANNVGKIVSGGSLIDRLQITELKLIKSTKNGTITITPVLSHRQDYYYKYSIDFEIDGTPVSDAMWTGKGIYKNDDNCLVIDKDNQLGTDTYQINCVVQVYIEGDDGIEVVLMLSRQLSLTIQ